MGMGVRGVGYDRFYEAILTSAIPNQQRVQNPKYLALGEIHLEKPTLRFGIVEGG